MTKHHPALLGIPALSLGLLLAAAPAEPRPPVDDLAEVEGVRELSGQVIARPRQPDALATLGWGPAEIAARIASARRIAGGHEVVAYVPETDEYVLRVSEGSTERALVRELTSTGLFQYAEPDWFLFPLACPDDPRFDKQWHHGLLRSCDGWGLHPGVPSVGVGVCDTGVRTTHEDLRLHRREAYNAVDRLWESQGGVVGPVNVHGTLTTGCAAANGDNGLGVAGMGWNLSHRMLRVTNDPTGRARKSDLQHAARTSAESGDRVVSISYAGVDKSSNLTTATYVKSLGSLLVWGAGNDGEYMAFGDRDDDDVIVVGGTTVNDARCSFSAHGPFVDLMAPAEAIRTTGANDDQHYGGGTGTSFATPLVAGLCALIWSADPSLSPDDVELILKTTCADLGATGVDDTFGHGRIDVLEAMRAVAGGSASVTWRNGAGVNPDVFSSLTRPVLGTTWRSRIDGGAVGAAGSTVVVGYSAPVDGVFTAFGELLVDTRTDWMVGHVAPGGSGLSVHEIAVPNEPAFLGVPVCTQGLVYRPSSGGLMSNALDLVLGD